MSLIADLKTLRQLVFHRIEDGSHESRLNAFYRDQAEDYDRFREKLLHGRKDFYESIPIRKGMTWVEMGAGTGRNLEYLGQRIFDLRKIYLVDLAESLLSLALQRKKKFQWMNAEILRKDIVHFEPENLVDTVVFSYSLSMIPNWIGALEKAYEILKPGGEIHIIDFYVAPIFSDLGMKQHSWWTRIFWPTWFGFDHVRIDSNIPLYLKNRFQTISLTEHQGPVPYLKLLGNVPYFCFHGRKN